MYIMKLLSLLYLTDLLNVKLSKSGAEFRKMLIALI